MRRQDELIQLYPGRDLMTRKFILSEAETLSLSFDSEELLDFLQRELGSSEGPIRNQALYTLCRFLPGFVRRRYGLSDAATGIWTRYRRDNRKSRIEALQDPTGARGRRDAFLQRSGELARALLSVGPTAGPRVFTLARLTLGNMPLRSVSRALMRPGGKATFEDALPYAMVHDPRTEDEELARLIAAGASDEPDLCLLLSEVTNREWHRVVLDLIPSVGPLGRVALAQVLPHLGGVDRREALGRLGRSPEGWVKVQCLRAIEALGDVDYLDVIRQVMSGAESSFLQVQAVRAAGGIRSPDSIAMCFEALEKGSEPVRAQAIESLIRLRCDMGTLARAASRYTASPSLRLCVNALLVSAKSGESAPAAEAMLMSNQMMSRLEGAFCLGYLQSNRSLQLLETLVTSDPSIHVRVQAVKSLSRYPARYSLPRLLPLTTGAHAGLALAAARVLTRYAGDQAKQVVDAMIANLQGNRQAFSRALMMRAIGSLGRRCGHPAVPSVLQAGLADPDTKVAQGAVEGMSLLGGEHLGECRDALRHLAKDPGRRLAPRALMALVLAGELEGVDGLVPLIAGGDEKTRASALNTALELAILLQQTECGTRYPLLAAALDKKMTASDFDQFSLSEVARSTLSSPVDRAEDDLDARVEPPSSQFALHRNLEEPPPETAKGGPQKSRRIPGSDPLAARLKDPDLVAASNDSTFQAQLRLQSYLIDEVFSRGNWGERLRANRKVLAIAAAVLFVVIMVTSRGSEEGGSDARRGSRPPVFVALLGGKPALDPPGKLVVGLEVVSGMTFVTGPGQSVSLVTRTGDTITMGESGRLVMEKVEEQGAVMVMKAAGSDFIFTLRGPGRFHIERDPVEIDTEGGVFKIVKRTKGLMLAVDSGVVRLKNAAGEEQSLAGREQVVLE